MPHTGRLEDDQACGLSIAYLLGNVIRNQAKSLFTVLESLLPVTANMCRTKVRSHTSREPLESIANNM
jgi:hypothetical protein